MPQIHHYHPDTGLYLGAYQADESPLEPGVYLVPAHATARPPPPCEAGERAVWAGDAWSVEAIPLDPAPPAPTPEDVRAAKIMEIESAYARSIAEVTAGYTTDERISWAVQEREARTWLADQATATPLLSAIASERGIPLADLAQLVATKSDQYAAIAGVAFGRRRMRLAAVAAAETTDVLAGIVW